MGTLRTIDNWYHPAGAAILTTMSEPGTDPFDSFAAWFKEAEASEPNDPNAMAVASVGADGMPSVRMVLLKGWDRDGLVFYTN